MNIDGNIYSNSFWHIADDDDLAQYWLSVAVINLCKPSASKK